MTKKENDTLEDERPIGIKPKWTVGDQMKVLFAQLNHYYNNPKSSIEEKNAAFCDEENLDALAQLMLKDETAFDQVLIEIHKITKLKDATIRKKVKDHINCPASPHGSID